MKLLDLIVSVSIIWMSCSPQPVQHTSKANTLVPFAKGINKPVCISNWGDSRLFVTDQTGYIWILDSTGHVNPKLFIDIHERVKYGGEQGLLGLAFSPQYKTNGYFYVNYVGKGDSTHISRFKVIPGKPGLADPKSEFKLMTIFQPFANHNGGDLKFGPDGFLYIGLGDGGSGGDPGNRAQNLSELLGKMLRIDVNRGNPYAIPPSNPFVKNAHARGEIWAYGLRNPWRFSFDRVNGDLWIADVGQNLIEEIDFQPAGVGGLNYGWRCFEGNKTYNDKGCGSATYTLPVHTYMHGEDCSVTGGYVYRGKASSAFYGYYFFADYCSDRIWTLHQAGGKWVSQLFGQFKGNNFSTFGEDNRGNLYVSGLTTNTIYRVSFASK